MHPSGFKVSDAIDLIQKLLCLSVFAAGPLLSCSDFLFSLFRPAMFASVCKIDAVLKRPYQNTYIFKLCLRKAQTFPLFFEYAYRVRYPSRLSFATTLFRTLPCLPRSRVIWRMRRYNGWRRTRRGSCALQA